MSKASLCLAGGCFWGVEELFRHQSGVLDTEVGYCGGFTTDPHYEEVKTGSTGHAEAVMIEFDPKQVRLEDLLLYFFRIHDPTSLNQQGNDRGSQYRSAIFYQSDEQKRAAEKVLASVRQAGHWKRPIITELNEFQHFYPAEADHQDYLQKHPRGYSCHFERPFNFSLSI